MLNKRQKKKTANNLRLTTGNCFLIYTHINYEKITFIDWVLEQVFRVEIWVNLAHMIIPLIKISHKPYVTPIIT